jgi:hypothetical protein
MKYYAIRSVVSLATACCIATAGLVLATAPAFADPSAPAVPVRLDAAKHLVTARIDGRLATLRALRTAVNAAGHLTAPHKSTLTSLIASDEAGLTTLRTKVNGETTVAAVRADDQSMVNDYRIYILVAPKVRLTIAADVEGAVVQRLRQVADTLATAISNAKQAGKNTSQAEADLADLRSQTDAASTAIAGKADALLAIQPGPDATAILNQVAPVRDAVRTARTDLRKAVADAKAARAALG